MSRRVDDQMDDQMDHQMDDRTNGRVRDRAERDARLVVASVRHDAGEPIVGTEGLVRRIC